MSDIWYAHAGPVDAPRIVVIHGTLDRSAGMLKLSRRLAERFRVTRFDRRGYGRSADAGPPFTVHANVDDLIAVIEVEATPVLLFGHSFGGNVALAVAERRPDLVTAVVSYESPMSWEPWWEGSTGNADMAAWRADPEGAAEGFMRRLVGDAVWSKLPTATRAARRSEGRAMVAELGDLKRAAPWSADRIGVPVLALCGEHGADHHRRAAQLLAELVADGEYAEVPGAKHFGPNTHPGKVADAVTGFSAACRSAP